PHKEDRVLPDQSEKPAVVGQDDGDYRQISGKPKRSLDILDAQWMGCGRCPEEENDPERIEEQRAQPDALRPRLRVAFSPDSRVCRRHHGPYVHVARAARNTQDFNPSSGQAVTCLRPIKRIDGAEAPGLQERRPGLPRRVAARDAPSAWDAVNQTRPFSQPGVP